MSTNLPLRVLYSLNGSPQYILARSQSAVPVEFIPSPGTGASSSSSPPPARYASASLKTCIGAICHSSPELLQDVTRDFSIYLLDPLEVDCAPAQANTSSKASFADALESRVAVGLGLMSWALMTEEAIPVTGTVKVSGTGQETLEVIFSLRQTLAMQRTSLPEASRSWRKPTTSTGRGIWPIVNGKPAVPYQSKNRQTLIPGSMSDKILAVAPIYVGPERRPQGRLPIPETISIEPEGHDDDDDDVVVLDGPPRQSGKDPSPVGKDFPGPSSLLDFLALVNVMTPEHERNKALGNVLSLVHGSDGTATPHPSADLANAMSLLSNLQRQHSQPDSVLPSHNQHRRKSSSNDDEIVCLNKENVNPKVFRRRAEREKDDPKLSNPSEPSTGNFSSGLPTPPSSQGRPEPPSRVSSNPPARKRTLSEFMAEQESIRDKEKASKRPQNHWTERSQSIDSFLPATIMPPPTTAPRQTNSFLRRTNSSSCLSSPSRGGFFTATAIAVPSRPSTSASSPIRPPPKPFVLPSWAQTDTATTPRLSDRAVEKMQEDEAKKKEEETKKREDEVKKRRQYYQANRGEQTQKRRKHNQEIRENAGKPCAEGIPLPPPVAASGEFPAFVKEQPSRPPFATLPFGSPSRSATQNNIPPCTPPRTRHADMNTTPGASSSLFTPDANPLFTPVPRSWDVGVLDLGRRSMSPSSRKRPPQDTDQTQPSEGPTSDNHDLGQELESAFDDLDFPMSSLPVASSDVQTEQMPSQGYDSDDSEDDEPRPKQHWVGLPPSSPPPPSSPFLGPIEEPFSAGCTVDEVDVEESPLIPPDVDPVSEQEILNSPDTEVVDYSMEEIGKLLNIEDLAGLFQPSTTDADAANFLGQFTNSPLDENSQPITDWGLDVTSPDFDFTEFWKSVEPLVQSSTQPLDMDAGETNDIDHAKLAGDVHALFSGCLV
ncbi:hypothetical protein MSAN_00004500 [Mycena sanguinolenta]|uniref:Uncharacterized protein n=1 Tax=Mycena sanguinolenta TaxID=230812 RepID=A0A8H6ZFF7_9AGAR|nr:hypothetical protein MSAN_00004500 [Mycena sanguinolenta]